MPAGSKVRFGPSLDASSSHALCSGSGGSHSCRYKAEAQTTRVLTRGLLLAQLMLGQHMEAHHLLKNADTKLVL